MNRDRRKKLQKIKTALQGISVDIENIMDTEEECLYNIPENLQSCERYENIESAIDKLDSALESIDDASGYIDDAINI